MSVTTQAIKQYYTEYFPLLNYDNQIEFNNEYMYLVSLSMRACETGEIYIKILNMWVSSIFIHL